MLERFGNQFVGRQPALDGRIADVADCSTCLVTGGAILALRPFACVAVREGVSVAFQLELRYAVVKGDGSAKD